MRTFLGKKTEREDMMEEQRRPKKRKVLCGERRNTRQGIVKKKKEIEKRDVSTTKECPKRLEEMRCGVKGLFRESIRWRGKRRRRNTKARRKGTRKRCSDVGRRGNGG